MLIGLGIDICRIDRIRLSVERFGDRFLNRIFTKAEIESCYRARACIYQSLAARFAGKEALYKALPPHIQPQIQWLDIQIERGKSTSPVIHFSAPFQSIIDQNQWKIWLTLTHEKEYAVAAVVIESSGF
ncbi:MAG: holo-ACP synthase [Candidatus Delongbacteria bacterium]|nr:holo-ACP synthase [Candidatus Delongbacteria bacterium]